MGASILRCVRGVKRALRAREEGVHRQQDWGSKTIAERLGIGVTSLYRYIHHDVLPAYLRFLPRGALRKLRMLSFNEQLILAWELAMAK